MITMTEQLKAAVDLAVQEDTKVTKLNGFGLEVTKITISSNY